MRRVTASEARHPGFAGGEIKGISTSRRLQRIGEPSRRVAAATNEIRLPQAAGDWFTKAYLGRGLGPCDDLNAAVGGVHGAFAILRLVLRNDGHEGGTAMPTSRSGTSLIVSARRSERSWLYASPIARYGPEGPRRSHRSGLAVARRTALMIANVRTNFQIDYNLPAVQQGLGYRRATRPDAARYLTPRIFERTDRARHDQEVPDRDVRIAGSTCDRRLRRPSPKDANAPMPGPTARVQSSTWTPRPRPSKAW